jgi:hypothetical protein
MKPVPSDPFALQQRIMNALIDDILDVASGGWPRLDALRETMKSTRSGRESNKPRPVNNGD